MTEADLIAVQQNFGRTKDLPASPGEHPVVPEPAALGVMGLAGLALVIRKRRAMP